MQSSSFGLKRILTLGLSCWTLILFTGCLESDITRHIKYKASDDSFEILSVFNHIRGKSTDDLDHAAELYEARSDLINPIAPITLFTEPAWIRKGDSKYLATNLGAGPEGTPAPKTTKIALDSITVKPGKFFFNKNGMPAYYHRIVLPGAAFDGFLARFSSSINEGIVDSIEKERKRRAEGNPVQTWENLRRKISQEPSEVEVTSKTGSPPLNLLHEDSLTSLAQAAAASNLKITRARTRFQITLPLTPADAKEAAKTIDLMKRKSLEAAKKEKTSPEAIAVLQSLRAESAESGELTLSVELGRLLSQGVEEPTLSTNDGKHMDNASVVEGLKERGITFDEELTHKAVVKEFLK